MKQLSSEREAKLNCLKRELVKSCVNSRYFNNKTCTYNAPRRKMSPRVKKLLEQIEELENGGKNVSAR